VSARARPVASGFTLLEMLITIAITAILVATAVRAYRDITSAQERAAGGIDRGRAADVVLDRLERELAGAFLIVQPPGEDPLAQRYLFVALDRPTSTSDGDALRFVTLTPARVPGAPSLRGPRMVTYAALPNEDIGFTLVRREEALPEGLARELSVEEGQVVLEDLAQFTLRYTNELGDAVEAWDSTQVEQLDQLPGDVQIEVSLLAPDENGDLVAGEARSRVVPLEVRPLDFVALRAAAGDEDGEGCVTYAQCTAALRGVIDAAPEAERESLVAELGAVAEECFDPAGDLATRLRGLGGDVETHCVR
jgi:prepilin-type N-terminal cleavage/methylation domain-containing protein